MKPLTYPSEQARHLTEAMAAAESIKAAKSRPIRVLSDDARAKRRELIATILGVALFFILYGLVGADEVNVRTIEHHAYHAER